MLKSMKLEDFTVFHNVEFKFGKQLNIVVGENGAGKSHVLKAAYAAIAVNATRTNGETNPPGKSQMQSALAEKFQSVFRPDGLGRLVRRQKGRKKCNLEFLFDETALNLSFTFSTLAKTEVTLKQTPKQRIEKLPVFLPTRELLAIYPGFVSLYETTHLEPHVGAHSALFPSGFAASVLQRLKQLVRTIDPNPLVLNIADTALVGVPWAVT